MVREVIPSFSAPFSLLHVYQCLILNYHLEEICSYHYYPDFHNDFHTMQRTLESDHFFPDGFC